MLFIYAKKYIPTKTFSFFSFQENMIGILKGTGRGLSVTQGLDHPRTLKMRFLTALAKA